MKTIYFILVFFLLSTLLYSTIINIPADQPTIQEGINAAVDTDTVLVQPGTYVENISFSNITVGSLYLTTQDTFYILNTIIDGNQNGSVVILNSSAIITGFTITNGSASGGYGCGGGGINCGSNSSNPSIRNMIVSNNIFSGNYGSFSGGGGIYCGSGTSPIIEDVIISNNIINGSCGSWSGGGGIYCGDSSTATIKNVTILGNIASGDGGGIYCTILSSPTIENVTISGNTASGDGGGIYCCHTSPILTNVTISNNSANFGSGIYCYDSSPSLVNSIVSDNTGNYGIYLESGNPSITYSDFYNNENGNFYNCGTGVGINVTTNANGDSCDVYYNIQMNPCFVDTTIGDYHLQLNSPCIDAGDLNSPLDPDGTIADMGAYYFDQLPYFPNADFLADITIGISPLIVDFTDLSTMALMGYPIIEWFWDFDNDGTIDSYEQNPQWIYTISGLYTVTLTVSDGSNTGTETKVNYITVWEPINADFEAVPLLGLAPLDVQFTDLSTGGLQSLVRETIKSNNSRDIVSWEWDFNNDGSIDSYEQNPQYTYTVAGLYTVTLAVSDGSNTGTETKMDYITVGEPILADFEADPILGSFPLDVQFTDLSNGGLETLVKEIQELDNAKVLENDNLRDIVSWEWDFDNNGVIDSYEQNPTHIYDYVGYYSVSLTVTDNNNNSDTLTKEDYIIVNPDIEFSYQTDGVIESGISLLSEDVLYCAASGDCVYRFNISGQIEYTLNVNGDVKSATTITPDHNVYIASTDCNLYSFNSSGVSNTGWPLSLGAEATASVASDSVGNIYIGTQNGIFQAVDPDGVNIWSYNVGAPVHSSAVISSDNTLYVINTNGRLYAFDLNTINPGNVVYKWIIETNGAVSSTPALDDINNIYIANENGQLIKINDDGFNGNVVWTFESGSAIIESSPLIDSNYNVYFGCDDGIVYSINDSGQLSWMSDEFDPIKSTGAIFESDEIQSRIYIGSSNGKLYALSIEDGSVLWQYTADSSIVCPILYNTGKIYFGTVNGEILIINDPDISTRTILRNISIWSTFQGNNLRTGNQTDNMVSVVPENINNVSYLGQNYPNPFNPTTTILFSLKHYSMIILEVYNIKGQKVKQLVNEQLSIGQHSVIWNGKDDSGKSVSSGIYFYKLKAGDYEKTKRMVLLK